MSGAGTREATPNQHFDEDQLSRYLAGCIDGFAGPIDVRQFAGGASNPTYLLTTRSPGESRRFVLRKKPPGPLLASAHQIEREYRIMEALRGSDVPVPVVRHLCENADVIGTPFYVMDFLEGRVFRDAALADLAPSERRDIYDGLNATLAKLHDFDYARAGLRDYGRPGNYFERQIARWTRQYRDSETEAIPTMEQLIEGLPGRIPADASSSIVHGDYRLENVMFHPSEPRVVAVLDWELSTIGHPLADLAYNCILWHSNTPRWGSLRGADFATSGIPTERSYVEAYCRRTRRADVGDWNFFLAFAAFRLASISQGVHRRNLNSGSAPGCALPNDAPAMAEVARTLFDRPRDVF